MLDSVIGQATLIVNARGVPGTLTGHARNRHNHQTVAISNWHVLFGEGADIGQPIWQVDPHRGPSYSTCLGHTLRGHCGLWEYRGVKTFVDCGLFSWSPGMNSHEPDLIDLITTPAKPGELVWKIGTATGKTYGTVVDRCFETVSWATGVSQVAPRQLLVRSITDQPFSAPGDSGAGLRNERGQLVGLLWGTDCQGQGIACPAEAALDALQVQWISDLSTEKYLSTSQP